MLLRKLRNWLFAGVAVLLPVWLTLFTLIWLFQNLDKAVTHPLRDYVNIPGLGVVLALALTLLMGWLTTHFLGRQIIRLGDTLMLRIPVVRALYSAVKQVTDAVLSPKEQAFSRVVLVEFPRPEVYCLGFVAGELPGTNLVRVWVPPGPSPTAGPVLLYPEAEIVVLPMSVEDGLKWVVSAGVLTPKEADALAMGQAVHELRARRARKDGGGVLSERSGVDGGGAPGA